jgi:hypothetical protein
VKAPSRFAVPPPHLHGEALDRYFWEQREEWHSTVLAEALDEVDRRWHEDKLNLAREKLGGQRA